MKITLRTAIQLAAVAMSITLAPGIAQAGQLLYDMSNPASPVIAVNTVTLLGNPGACSSFEPYSQCAGNNFKAPTGTVAIRVLDGFTSATTTFAVSAGYTTLIADTYSSPQNSSLSGGFFLLAWEGAGNFASLGSLLQDFNPAFSATQPCNGQCVGQLTGSVQNAATISYLNADASVIGTDTIDFIAAGTVAPEPSTALLLIPGLAVLCFGATRRHSRR